MESVCLFDRFYFLNVGNRKRAEVRTFYSEEISPTAAAAFVCVNGVNKVCVGGAVPSYFGE